MSLAVGGMGFCCALAAALYVMSGLGWLPLCTSQSPQITWPVASQLAIWPVEAVPPGMKTVPTGAYSGPFLVTVMVAALLSALYTQTAQSHPAAGGSPLRLPAR